MKRSWNLLFFLFLFLSCDEEKIKTIKEKWEDGSPKVVITYIRKADTLNYIKDEYYSNGNKSKNEIFKNNDISAYEYFYPNGSIKSKGILDRVDTLPLDSTNNTYSLGEFSEWSPNGKLHFYYKLDASGNGMTSKWDSIAQQYKKEIYKNGDWSSTSYTTEP